MKYFFISLILLHLHLIIAAPNYPGKQFCLFLPKKKKYGLLQFFFLVGWYYKTKTCYNTYRDGVQTEIQMTLKRSEFFNVDKCTLETKVKTCRNGNCIASSSIGEESCHFRLECWY